MTTELFYLLPVAILTGVLWLPTVIGYVSSRGPLKPADYKIAPTSPLPARVNRANRAHQNAVENIRPFAVELLRRAHS
ncbi:MAG TPA: MAPEG family protein [Burkholderiales bacterium]|nr:MAPEG family protein [Burkholderiales bacterium]